MYYAGQRKSASVAQKLTPASLGVFYLSRWKEDEAAQTFEKMYSAQVARKYAGVSERKKDEADGEVVFTTSEGDVLLSLMGRDLWVSEGFPLPLARKLRDLGTAVQGSGPLKMAAGHELTLRTAGALAGFGMINPETVGRYTFPWCFQQQGQDR